jgi:hypothetical protein
VGLQNNIAKLGKNLKNVIQSIIKPVQIRELARETGFVKRCSSRLKGDEFVQTLIIESVDGERNTLRGAIDTLGSIRSKAAMTIQAIGNRINTNAAATLLQRVFEKTLHVVMNQMNQDITIKDNNLKLLNFFDNVYLQDSTETQLDPELKDDYKGSGGGSGNGKGDASFKVDLIFEYKRKFLSSFKVTDRRDPDAVLGEKILDIIKKGDLVIRDLGYSCIGVFKQIHEAGAFFLSRLHASLNVYLNKQDALPISLGEYLKRSAGKSGIVDAMIYIGREMYQCRMIAYRVHPELEKERRDEYIKECKKKKRTPNKEYINRLAFTIFITNVPLTMWPAKVIGTIYRLRWQVELIFKSWKSDLKFDFLIGTNPFRVKCLIYARLTAILMMFTVYSRIDSVALEVLEKEISIHKIIDWLKKNGRFFEIVTKGFSKDLWMSLLVFSELILCKDKRKGRKTTRDLVKGEVSFGFTSS